MIIKLLSVQIPKFWEPIKTAVIAVDEVQEKDLQSYLNELLHALLNDKAQCFIRLTDDRVLVALLITRIMLNKVTGEKYLSAEQIYSWKKHEASEWEEWKKLVLTFAENEKCKYIEGRSRHGKVIELAKSVGFTERYTVFDLQLR